jgi:hypothetical protein
VIIEILIELLNDINKERINGTTRGLLGIKILSVSSGFEIVWPQAVGESVLIM